MRGNVHGGKQLGKDKVCLGVHLTREIHTRLLEDARSKELSLSDVVRIALKDYLAKLEA